MDSHAALAGEVFGTLFDHGVEAAFVVDRASHRILSANERLADMVGYAPRTLVGTAAAELFADPPRHDDGEIAHVIDRAGLHEEVALRRLDGYRLYVVLTVAHIEHGSGPLAACLARDATERRRLEREVISKHTALYAAHADLERAFASLAETQRHLDERNREIAMLGAQLAHVGRRAAIGEFSAGIAHSMNNPMGALASTVRQIAARVARHPDAQLRDDLARFIERSQRALTQLEGIVSAVHRSHRSGTLDMRSQSLDLAREIDNALSLFEAHLGGIEVQRSYPPDATAWVPPDALHQVLSNLLDNAIRAMPDGGVLRVVVERQPGRLTISVSDTGKGVAPELVTTVFEPFLSARAGGTGLGLGTAQRLARMWGGDVQLAASDVGARFDITIPCKEP